MRFGAHTEHSVLPTTLRMKSYWKDGFKASTWGDRIVLETLESHGKPPSGQWCGAGQRGLERKGLDSVPGNSRSLLPGSLVLQTWPGQRHYRVLHWQPWPSLWPGPPWFLHPTSGIAHLCWPLPTSSCLLTSSTLLLCGHMEGQLRCVRPVCSWVQSRGALCWEGAYTWFSILPSPS